MFWIIFFGPGFLEIEYQVKYMKVIVILYINQTIFQNDCMSLHFNTV